MSISTPNLNSVAVLGGLTGIVKATYLEKTNADGTVRKALLTGELHTSGYGIRNFQNRISLSQFIRHYDGYINNSYCVDIFLETTFYKNRKENFDFPNSDSELWRLQRSLKSLIQRRINKINNSMRIHFTDARDLTFLDANNSLVTTNFTFRNIFHATTEIKSYIQTPPNISLDKISEDWMFVWFYEINKIYSNISIAFIDSIFRGSEARIMELANNFAGCVISSSRQVRYDNWVLYENLHIELRKHSLFYCIYLRYLTAYKNVVDKLRNKVSDFDNKIDSIRDFFEKQDLSSHHLCYLDAAMDIMTTLRMEERFDDQKMPRGPRNCRSMKYQTPQFIIFHGGMNHVGHISGILNKFGWKTLWTNEITKNTQDYGFDFPMVITIDGTPSRFFRSDVTLYADFPRDAKDYRCVYISQTEYIDSNGKKITDQTRFKNANDALKLIDVPEIERDSIWNFLNVDINLGNITTNVDHFVTACGYSKLNDRYVGYVTGFNPISANFVDFESSNRINSNSFLKVMFDINEWAFPNNTIGISEIHTSSNPVYANVCTTMLYWIINEMFKLTQCIVMWSSTTSQSHNQIQCLINAALSLDSHIYTIKQSSVTGDCVSTRYIDGMNIDHCFIAIFLHPDISTL
jgi:hypothetical protein